VCWFLLAYFPTSNTLIPLYSVMGEQYIYIASAGIVAAAVAAVWAVALAQGIPRAATLGAMLLVAAYAARSVVRTRDWRDELSFYRATVAASPQSAFMHVELGTTHLVRGELALAEREFRTALTLNPSYAPAHFNLGITALVQGRLDEAESFLRRSLALRPDYAPAHFNMGVLASRRGQTQDAIHWFESAAAIDPERAETHLALGKAYLPINSHRAAQHLRRFLALAPEHP
jgi:tetratricopeptide (TPR) repeat protein